MQKPFQPGPERPPNTALDQRNEWIVAAYLAGLTLEAIGQQYNITRERVRQIVRMRIPAAPGLRRQERIRVGRAGRNSTPRKDEFHGYVCRVCWQSFATSRPINVKSCSTRCSDLWRMVRRAIDREGALAQRRTIARHMLKYPERFDEIQIRYARKVLSGRITVRPYVGRRGSAMYAAVAEVLRLRHGQTPPPGIDPAEIPALMERSA